MQYAGKSLSNPLRRLGWIWAARGLRLNQLVDVNDEEKALIKEGYQKRIEWCRRRARR